LLREYDLYLHKERSFSPATRVNYAPSVRQFLVSRFGCGRVVPSRLHTVDILKFIRRTAGQHKSKRILLMTTDLRSFIRLTRLSRGNHVGFSCVCAVGRKLVSFNFVQFPASWRLIPASAS